MDSKLQSHRAHIVYRQALNWHQSKVLQHILARNNDRRMKLGLVLAMMSHRLASFPDSSDSFSFIKSPCDLGIYVVENCEIGSDEDRAVSVKILCEIADHHMSKGMTFDSEQIRLLILMSVRLCQQFKSKGMLLVSSIHALELLLERKIAIHDLDALTLSDSKLTIGSPIAEFNLYFERRKTEATNNNDGPQKRNSDRSKSAKAFYRAMHSGAEPDPGEFSTRLEDDDADPSTAST